MKKIFLLFWAVFSLLRIRPVFAESWDEKKALEACRSKGITGEIACFEKSAENFFNQGKYEQSFKAAESLLNQYAKSKNYPGVFPVFFEPLMEKVERRDKAVKMLDRALREAPNEKTLFKVRAGLNLNLGEKESAAKDMEKYAELENTPAGYDSLALFYDLKLKDRSKAVEALNRGVLKFPGKEEAYGRRAQFHRKHAGSWDSCISDFSQALALSKPEKSSYKGYLLDRADCEAKKGDVQAALKDMEKAAELFKDTLVLDRLVDFYRIRMRDLDSALSVLNAAVELSTSDAAIYARRASFHKNYSKDYDSCAGDYTQALSLSKPENSSYKDYLSGRAQCEASKGDKEAAVQDMEKASDLQGGSYGYKNLSDFYRNLGETDKALDALNRGVSKFPDDSRSYLQRAEFHREMGNWDLCISDYTHAFDLNPKSFNWRLAECRAKKGDKQAALKDMEKAAELSSDVWGYGKLADFYLEQFGDMDRALEALDKAVQLHPEDSYSYSRRGEFHRLRSKDFKACIKDYSRAMEIQPDYGVWAGYLSECEAGRGNKKSRLRGMEKYAETASGSYGYGRDLAYVYLEEAQDPAKAKEALDRGVQAFPAEAESYSFRADFERLYFKNWEACIKDYSKAFQISPDPSFLQKRALCRAEKKDKEGVLGDLISSYKMAREGSDLHQLREAAGALAEAMLRRGYSGYAQALWDRVAALSAGNREALQKAYVKRGDFRLRLGDLNSAEENYQSALSMDPNNSDVLFALGRVYSRRGDREKTAEVCSNLRSLSAEGADPAWRCGSLYEEMKDYDKALKVYDDLLKVFKPQDKDWDKLAVARAKVYVKKGDMAAAEKEAESLRKPLEKIGKEEKYYDLLGLIHEAAGRYEKALEAYGRFREISGFPGLDRTPGLAAVYLKMGQKEKALEEINFYLAKYPESPEGNEKRSEIHRALGRTEEPEAVPQEARGLIIDSLIRILQGRDPEWKSAVLWFISNFKEPRVKEAILEALSDEDSSVRKQALKSFMERKEPDSIQVLIGVLKGPYADLKSMAVSALASLDVPELEDLLISAMEGEKPGARKAILGAAAESLTKTKDPRLPRMLFKILQGSYGDLKPKAASALVSIPLKDLFPQAFGLKEFPKEEWEKAFLGQEEGVRKGMASSLSAAKSTTDTLFSVLILYLHKDPNSDIRYSVLNVLSSGNWEGNSPAFLFSIGGKPLIAASKDSDLKIRLEALKALSHILGPTPEEADYDIFREELLGALAGAVSGDSDPQVKAQAEKVLSQLKMTKGDLAEKRGNFQEAFDFHMGRLPGLSGKEKREAREKIISLYQKLDSPPDVPREASKHMRWANAAFEQNDLKSAVEEYQKALDLAPWDPEAYLQLGIKQEAGNNYQEAMEAFQLYLKAAPDADNVAAIQNEIDELEYKVLHSQPQPSSPAKAGSADQRKKTYGFDMQTQAHPEGFLVQCVWKGFPAQSAGILPGDRIQKINDVKPSTAQELIQLMRSYAEKRSDQPLKVLASRNGAIQIFNLKSPQPIPAQAPEKSCQ